MQIYGNSVRTGIHSGQIHGDYNTCRELWTRADELGYDWVSLIDHFRPHVYPPGHPCFEGTTLLAAMAASTSRIRCSILVSAITWRHPAILANVASTVDHISNGRLELGVGAGGPDRAYGEYRIPFPDSATRVEMLEEACQVIRGLLDRDMTTFHGRHFSLQEAHLAPKPVQRHIPLIVGAEGLRGALRVAAGHGDIWNTLACGARSYQTKLAAFEAHCEAVNRDPRDVRKSVTFRAVLADTEGAAQKRARALLEDAPGEVRAEYLTLGNPDACLDDLKRFADLGVRDFLLAVKPPIDWHTLEVFAERVAPRLRAYVTQSPG
ncbi:LLM class flavin-dependent oxidoreductase [Nonomuraea sp. NPDC050786]|uniref:LLM class flavin-dependent oxidoreductase n=1 Tax=Nonomuraea sp. NPDC050786 TaxID=3154840 RepID=UPI0033EA1FDF